MRRKIDTTYWFDASFEKGALITEAEAQQQIATGNTAIHHLGELLLCEEFPFKKGDFPLLRAEGVGREECIALGKIAVGAICEAADESPPLSLHMLGRLYILGLGIYPYTYYHGGRLRSFEELWRLTGSPEGHTFGRFDRWGVRQFRKLAENVEAQVGKKPTKVDYIAYAAEHPRSPGLGIINEKVDGVSRLNELIGYPAVKDWVDEDYIMFGVNFVEVNGTEKLTKATIDILSERQRGPSYSSLKVHFSSWENYKKLVQQHIIDTKLHVSRYRTAATSGDLPAEYAQLSDNELLQRGARFELINELAPDLSSEYKQVLANRSRADNFAASFAKLIARFNLPRVAAGVVELEAKRMGLDEFIWPRAARYRDHISVSDEELAERRRIHAKKHRQWKSRKAA